MKRSVISITALSNSNNSNNSHTNNNMHSWLPVIGAPPSSGGGSHRMVTTLGWLLGQPGTRCGLPGGHGGTGTVWCHIGYVHDVKEKLIHKAVFLRILLVTKIQTKLSSTMTVFRDAAPYNLVETDRCSRGALLPLSWGRRRVRYSASVWPSA